MSEVVDVKMTGITFLLKCYQYWDAYEVLAGENLSRRQEGLEGELMVKTCEIEN